MRLDHHPQFDQPANETQKTYIVFSSGRTGSTWLALGLYKLGLGVPLEYFNRTQCKGFAARLDVAEGFHDERDLAHYIQEILPIRTTRNGVFGASIHIHQWLNLFQKNIHNLTKHARIDWLIQTLQNSFPNPHFIFLYREDLLMQAISMNIARQTDAWSSTLNELREPQYNYQSIKKTLATIVYGVGVCKYFQKQIKAPKLEFLYEDLEQDYDHIIGQILQMLDINIEFESGLSSKTINKQRTNRNQQWKQRFLQEHKKREG